MELDISWVLILCVIIVRQLEHNMLDKFIHIEMLIHDYTVFNVHMINFLTEVHCFDNLIIFSRLIVLDFSCKYKHAEIIIT